MIGSWLVVSLSHPGICLTTEKRHVNLSYGSLIVFDNNCCIDLATKLRSASAGLLSISHSWLTVDDFRPPLMGTSAFQDPN
jgi:hypothetical protein